MKEQILPIETSEKEKFLVKLGIIDKDVLPDNLKNQKT